MRVSADAKLQLLHASGASAGVNLGGLLAEEEEVAEAGGTASSGRLRENAGGSGGVRRWSQTAEDCNSCNMEHCNSCNMLQVGHCRHCQRSPNASNASNKSNLSSWNSLGCSRAWMHLRPHALVA